MGEICLGRLRNLTRSLPTVLAKFYGHQRAPRVRVIVIHSTESSEVNNGARAVANFFAKIVKIPSSAHIVVDNKTKIRCVPDSKSAWAAPGCNFDGLHLELVGRAGQTKKQWSDSYSKAVLQNAAEVVASWVELYNIPIKRLTRAELKAGKSGLCGHVDVSNVYKLSNHWDPGPNFPWDDFLRMVKNATLK